MIRSLTTLSVRCRARAGLRSGTRLDSLRLWCGSRDSAGVDEVPEWRDWTDQETTPDQLRIEDVLEGELVTGSAILHIGIGNSSLARRFHSRARIIDGITIQKRELELALRLAIPNYTPRQGNKYSPNLPAELSRRYDFIVDNNPTTFCCCRTHLATMLANYSVLLRANGVLLSDKVGLHWTSEPNDPRWAVAEDEWSVLGGNFGLRAVRYTDFVVGLRKGSSLQAALQATRSLNRFKVPLTGA